MAPTSIRSYSSSPNGNIYALHERNVKLWSGPFSATSVDLIAMVVSDSGLASADPEWWNSSILGCIFIGLQPRGGWQVMQRTVQWGQDTLANIFGVRCSMPALYAYFACSMRNRLEVWDSDAWTSPTEESSEWSPVGQAHLKRPTKLIDGSRGGQGFICDLLRPRDGSTFSIEEQARMQFLSVGLVAAGLMHPERLKDLRKIMQDDFEIGNKLGSIFSPLVIGLAIGQLVSLALSISTIYAIFRQNLFQHSAAYIVQLCSMLSWAVGAIGLLMLGGNPRVKIVKGPVPDYIKDRISAREENADEHKSEVSEGDELEIIQVLNRDGGRAEESEVAEKPTEETEDAEKPTEQVIRLEFGSVHGSVYVSTRGHCYLPPDVVRMVCGWDLVLQRPLSWLIGFVWCCIFLLISILLQIAGAQVASIGSEAMAVGLLMVTALARGWGVSGPEEWLIPRRKRRRGAAYGASLLGKMVARQR